MSSRITENKQHPDVYAVGFQEVTDYVGLPSEHGKRSEWEEITMASLVPDVRYKKLETVSMKGILLMVFVKESLLRHITNVESNYVGTGLMYKMGNKGAVAIRFDLHKTSLVHRFHPRPKEVRVAVEDMNEDEPEVFCGEFEDIDFMIS